ncbi:hypothetical protein H257_02610 [Aphanomyces astaci]|uniref:Uncharacterized protein n=1 Tax=Aphanomyces astaci TaxID=112090 RepID=W4H4U2_APHAT|nr:hypothetical protein H257_02610 [Aphanomyces astaci]ETV86153.1 hypothetical protein H257_02610 [Aphanomyces astaci]|eukprot:XP_009824625.1 hypothetical protein H257_02610 [Aphanomyces astaci]
MIQLPLTWITAVLLVGPASSRLYAPPSNLVYQADTVDLVPRHVDETRMMELPPIDSNYLQWYCETFPYDLNAAEPPTFNSPIQQAMWAKCKAYFDIP